jgi:hypothetical protein
MDPFLVMMYQTALSFVAFALIARWYVLPWLSQLPLESALIALSWPHVFRYVALSAFLPGQVAPEVTRGPLSAVIYGDTLSGLLALVAILMLKYRISGAIWAAWIFNLVGLADWAQSQVQHLQAGSFQHDVGASALVYVFYVPPLVISHLVMLYWLATRRRERTEEIRPSR